MTSETPVPPPEPEVHETTPQEAFGKFDRSMILFLIVLALIAILPIVASKLSDSSAPPKPSDPTPQPVPVPTETPGTPGSAPSSSREEGSAFTAAVVAAPAGARNPGGQAAPVPGAPPSVAEEAAALLTHRFEIPLKDGKIRFGALLGRLADRFGVDGEAIEERLKFDFQATGLVGGTIMKQLQKLTRGVVSFEAEEDRLMVTLDRLQLRREEGRLRSGFRDLMTRWFPKAAAAASARYGTQLFRPDDEPEEATRLGDVRVSGPAIVLLHGIDEPGLIWRDLRPRLLEAGFNVAQVEYPNDQPIDDSTAFVADELAKLKQAGARRIGVIGHSMGGLIARHLLTDERWYGGRGSGNDRYPDVARLIMVAVPQRGSQLVRLRIVTEARDQIARMLSGDGMLFGGIFDGAGEAKLDLLPNSEFLIGLNRRTHPLGVQLTIIAGNASPVSEAGIGRVAESLKDRFGDRLEERIEKISSSLQSLSAGMGDGAVSLASTRLEGVEDYHVVRANHLSMLRSLIPGSPSVPPAIPIILERLTQER